MGGQGGATGNLIQLDAQAMKTAILDQPGTFKFAESSHPGAPGTGQVLARVLTIGICGTDLHAFEGTQPFFTYPRVLGHELAVEILAVGDDAGELAPGD